MSESGQSGTGSATGWQPGRDVRSSATVARRAAPGSPRDLAHPRSFELRSAPARRRSGAGPHDQRLVRRLRRRRPPSGGLRDRPEVRYCCGAQSDAPAAAWGTHRTHQLRRHHSTWWSLPHHPLQCGGSDATRQPESVTELCADPGPRGRPDPDRRAMSERQRANHDHGGFSARSAPSRLLLGLIRAYQSMRAGRPSPCRFEPSCSCYALEAIEAYGSARGGWLGARRLARCHPWGGQGWDPVPESTPARQPQPDRKAA